MFVKINTNTRHFQTLPNIQGEGERLALRSAVEFQYFVVNILGHKTVDDLPLLDALAYVGAADGVEPGIDEMHIRRQGGFINGEAFAWINRDFVVGENVCWFGPSVEGQPVVGTDDENELTVGIIGGEMFERVPCIGGLGEVELVVGGHETRLVLERLSGEAESQIIGKKVVVGCFEGVEWGDDKPNFVECGLFQNLLGQGDVPGMNGVEAAAEDTYTLLRRERIGVRGVILGWVGGHVLRR